MFTGALLLLLLASAFFACGGLFMKYSDGLSRLVPSLAVFALFGAGAACQAVAMKRSDMGVAYVFVLGAEAVLAFALSVAVLGEKVSSLRIAAIVVIVAGIAMLQRS